MEKTSHSNGSLIAEYHFPGATVEIRDDVSRNKTEAEQESVWEGTYRAAWDILNSLKLKRMDSFTEKKDATGQSVTKEALYRLVGRHYPLPPVSGIEFAEAIDRDLWMLSWPWGSSRVSTASVTVQHRRILITLSTDRGLRMHWPEEGDLAAAGFTWRPKTV